MVVWPTATPGTSVMASSGAVGRMPTFRPKSEARGRGLGGVSWVAANAAVTKKTVTTAKNLLSMGVVYGQNTFENGSALGTLGRGFLDWNRSGTSERFQETDNLPALRFGQLGPYRHATADDTVGQNPENCAWFGGLDIRNEKTWPSLSAFGFTAVALRAVLRVQNTAGGDRFGVVPKRILSGASLVWSFFDFSINGVFFLRCAGSVLG